MPPYAHFATQSVDFAHTKNKLGAMKMLGVPYTREQVDAAESDAHEQAKGIAQGLASEGIEVKDDAEMVAVVAYLQRLGRVPPSKSANGPAITRR